MSGRDVTVVTPLATPILLDAETVAHALPLAARAGIRWRPSTVLAAIGEHDVTLVDALTQRAETVPVDAVVVRTHGVADGALYLALEGRVPEVVRVGDAVAVRFADRAIFDGHMTGRRL